MNVTSNWLNRFSESRILKQSLADFASFKDLTLVLTFFEPKINSTNVIIKFNFFSIEMHWNFKQAWKRYFELSLSTVEIFPLENYLLNSQKEWRI